MYSRRLPERLDFLKVKILIKVKSWWIVAAMTGRFYEWVGVFLEKRAKNVSCGNISLAVIAKNKEQGKENMLRDLYIFCNLSCLGVSVNTAGHVW